MKYGYARVSTLEQNPALQIDALRAAGCSEKAIFVDHGTSGAGMNRAALKRCLKAIKPGDTLVVWKLDRLGRGVRDLLNLLHDLDKRKIAFHSLTEAINTATPTGRAMLHMIALLAELERELMMERITAGRKAAKQRGVKFGPHPKLNAEQRALARDLIDQGRAKGEVADLLRVDRTTLWRALRD